MFTKTGWYSLDGKRIFVDQVCRGVFCKWDVYKGWENLSEEDCNKLVLLESIEKENT